MEKYSVKFKKRFGQNFLKDTRVVKRIISISDVEPNSLVIEVGPGGAILTKELANSFQQVLCYEVDLDLKEELSHKLDGFSNVEVRFQDFLLSDIASDIQNYSYENLYFISNVPYYITTPILLKLINSKLHFRKIVMMVQKEVGERFSTSCGNKQYGSITVLLNYFYDIKREFSVSRKEFVPEPNVDSVVVSFTEKEEKFPLVDFSFFQQLVYDSFQFKRKTIRNNLKKYDLQIVEDVLKKYHFDLNTRAEMLPVEVFVDLSNRLGK
ncbi:MAG: ribosomal RNA small subunit methyltransferase A [Bacilli bacterium]|nr:ribosomal RNA small subunit methyltransferase A [Bacilli bacterium]